MRILAHIAPIQLEKATNRLRMPVYKGDKLGTPRIVDIACIQCVIGRVKDGTLWTVIDRGEMGRLLESLEDVCVGTGD